MSINDIKAFTLLCLLFASCIDTPKVTPINPNGDSELAILMREMYADAERMKSQLGSERIIRPEIDHHQILTADGTQPDQVASAEYKAFAQNYLYSLDALTRSSEIQDSVQYRHLVNNCLTCHKAMCPGPMIKIRKLSL